jgi:hypothetical protein
MMDRSEAELESHCMARGETPGALSIVVQFDGNTSTSLVLCEEDQHLIVSLDVRGLNEEVIRHWLSRFGVVHRHRKDVTNWLPKPVVNISTLVICCDPRVADLAELYAKATGTAIRHTKTCEELELAVESAKDIGSVTIFILNDEFEETTCHLVWRANQRRLAHGDQPLKAGFMTAFTSQQLAWLVTKTLILLQRPQLPRVGFANYHAATSQITTRIRAADTGATCDTEIENPWSCDEIMVMSVCAHGVSFDASLGRVALCGHLDPPLPSDRIARAPVCFHDGNCFRLNRAVDAPVELLRSVHAAPLVWCLNSCHAVSFASNSFGDGTGYVYGLVAGAAVAVIGSYLSQPTTELVNRAFEGLIATGATTGQTVAALCRLEDPEADYDPFVLLGSPDLQLLPTERWQGTAEAEAVRYAISGPGRLAFRLRSMSLDGNIPFLVSDDGSESWNQAICLAVSCDCEQDLLVMLDEPADLEGWLAFALAGKDDREIREESEEQLRRVEVLSRYPFCDDESLFDSCRTELRRILEFISVRHLLRRRIYMAVMMANYQMLLDRAQIAAIAGFINLVTTRDFSFDRESYNGFIPGPLRRTLRRCPTCDAALYEAHDRWEKDHRYRRRKDVCPNCIGVSMVLETSPLVVHPPVIEAHSSDGYVHIRLVIENPADVTLSARLAAAPRHGPAEAAQESIVDVPPQSKIHWQARFPLASESKGVVSYRFIVLCLGAAEFHNVTYENLRRIDETPA